MQIADSQEKRSRSQTAGHSHEQFFWRCLHGYAQGFRTAT